MFKRMVFCLAVLIGLSVNAQTINLRGVVSARWGTPIGNAVITLVGQGLRDTSAVTTGAYSITRNTAVQLPSWVPQTEKISLNRGILEFSLKNSSPVKVEVFDVKGNLQKKEIIRNAAAGNCRLNIADNTCATKLLVVKLSIGERVTLFRYLPLNSGKITVDPSVQYTTPVGDAVAILATVDSLRAAGNGYTTKTLPLSKYDSTVNIVLDSAPGPSIGCGKALSGLRSGTYTITSAGLSRQYIIDIPTNYDKTRPYRLIFGMHCYGSNMQGVANDKYYQLKRFADSTNIPCIFVAPNGTGSTPLWNQGAADHTFFDDMLKLFKDSLCVDTTRVFSCGFSYGAMFTYSLSTNHQKKLRAVACYAPANWNIWLPTNTHEPIAYFQTTGTDDQTCKWLYDTTKQLGGKYCLLGHIIDNGCTVPSTIPLATSSTHLSTEFSGCTVGYPVKFGSFQGGHQCGPMDGVSGDNSSKSWIPGETWNFFMRF
jgi:hypothetical protein